MLKTKNGFTIVELLIVTVVIAILAAISVVAYNGIQQRARDAQRQQQIKTLVKALDMYYLDNNQYPQITATSPGLGSGAAISSTPFKATWDQFSELLRPYLPEVPKDPINSALEYRFTYTSYSNNSTWPILCPASQPFQSYSLTYRNESKKLSHEVIGSCNNNQKPWLPASDEVSTIVRVNP